MVVANDRGSPSARYTSLQLSPVAADEVSYLRMEMEPEPLDGPSPHSTLSTAVKSTDHHNDRQ